MMQLERQKKILDYLNKNRKATTKELSQLLDVSTTTIRTDLNQMDRENLITKTPSAIVLKTSKIRGSSAGGACASSR